MLGVIVVVPGLKLAKRVEHLFDVDTEQERTYALICQELEVVGADGVSDMVPPDVVGPFSSGELVALVGVGMGDGRRRLGTGILHSCEGCCKEC